MSRRPLALSEIQNDVRQIFQEASRLMLTRPDILQTAAKSARNYVTEIDLAVERLIVARLRQLTPDFAVITEEAAGNRFVYDRPTWILDPVDGTSNLMRDCHHSAISLALAGNGGLQLGLIYNPYLAELFAAEANQGAFLNGRRIQVSQRADLGDCLIGFGTTPYVRAEAHRTFDLLERVFLQVLEIRRFGSAALDLAYVACGRLDGFFELALQPWDYAAGILIVQEAGGRVTNWDDGTPDLCRPDSILATNSQIHRSLFDLINKH
jgi:myo-inositol-1(or 4)-monophosphatase